MSVIHLKNVFSLTILHRLNAIDCYFNLKLIVHKVFYFFEHLLIESISIWASIVHWILSTYELFRNWNWTFNKIDLQITFQNRSITVCFSCDSCKVCTDLKLPRNWKHYSRHKSIEDSHLLWLSNVIYKCAISKDLHSLKVSTSNIMSLYIIIIILANGSTHKQSFMQV